MKYDYPTAFSLWGAHEQAAMLRVEQSGQFTQGPEVAAFEQEFAAYHGRDFGIMVNSGSSANLVVIAALKEMKLIKAGDTAVVPAIAWSTTYAPLVQHGLDLHVADVDDTWNADPLELRDPPKNTKIVVACSVLGNPAYLKEWQSIAGVLGAVMIEDNCESLGAITDQGRKTGTFGIASTFSFFFSHQISAIEGGMILTDNETLAQYCRMLRAHGWTRDCIAWDKPTGFHAEYDFQCFGYNVRALELHAAIARAQLSHLPQMLYARQMNADCFWQVVMNTGVPIDLPIINGGTESPFGLNFTLRAGADRNRVARALRAHGIDCRLPTGGSFLKQAYGAPWRNQETPVADQIHDTGMFLGCAPFDIKDKIRKALDVLKWAAAPEVEVSF